MSDKSFAELRQYAKNAQKNAVVPFSNFPVGAALRTKSGKIYTGCNIENSSYGLTVCAERVAMFKALSEGETGFDIIVIAANTRDFCPPCGACRQVLFEHAPKLEVILINSTGDTKETSVAGLLPEAFDRRFLVRE